MSSPSEQPVTYEPASPWGGLFQVLTRPRSTFALVAERAPIAPPYLLFMVVSVVGALVILPMALEQMVAVLPAGAPSEAVAAARIGGWIGGLLTALLSPWIYGLLTALVCLVAGRVFGVSVPFRTYLSLAGYARLPDMIGGLAHSFATVGTGSVEQGMAVFSPAIFLPEGVNGLVRLLVLMINPFGLWSLGLLMVGFAFILQMPFRKAIPFGVALVLLDLALLSLGM